MNKKASSQERIAMVTGASRRIGAAIIRYLHDAGFKVVIHYHKSAANAHALAVELNDKKPNSAIIFQQDLVKPDASENLLKGVRDWCGRLDVLVNNASVFIKSEPGVFNEKDWDLLFDVNVKAPFALSQAAFPLLSEVKGVIINITDIHAHRSIKDYSVYCQTKAALALQTHALAKEFAPLVRVNGIAPGSIIWPENDNRLSDDMKNKIIGKTPLQKHGDPIYVAQAVLSLIENPFITGQILAVDGGRSLV